jgi:hypothetical protein
MFHGPDDDCRPWKGWKDYNGYGRFVVTGNDGVKRSRPAHVVSWEVVHGPFPPGLIGCHTCCHPWCVNPNHIYPGTPINNGFDLARHRKVLQRNIKTRALMRRWREEEEAEVPPGLA